MSARSLLMSLALVGPMAAPAHADHMANCRPLSAADGASIRDRPAVVTDIDGVLTQYILQDYVPTNGAFVDRGIAYPRTDAALLMNVYQRRGYLLVYLAFRPRNLEVMGRSMCDATLAWLHDHGFPTEQGDTLLLLAEASDRVTRAANKGLAMAKLAGDDGTRIFVDMIEAVQEHYAVRPRYGYADSDVVTDAFLEVGVPAGQTFTIGNKGMSALGYRGSEPIVGPGANPGFTEHIERFVIPRVPETSR